MIQFVWFGSGLVNPRLIFKIKLQSLICSIFRAIDKIKISNLIHNNRVLVSKYL
jgi:hypothetical protein